MPTTFSIKPIGDADNPWSTNSLIIVVITFCLLMLRAGWNDGRLPSLEGQGNWIWLVTAALGGKALQKFAEVQEKKEKFRQHKKGEKKGG